jgi:hypothetical protein
LDIQTKYFDKLKSEQTFAAIYTDHYDESDYGFIMDFNEDFLVLEKFNSDCFYDGISIFVRENITRIRWGGNEITSTSKLIDGSQRQQTKISVDLTSIQTILQTVHDSFEHITVHIQDIDKSVCFIGQIHEMDSEYLVIYEYGTKLSLDRKYILIALDNITRVDAGGHYEKNLEKLFVGQKK